MAAARVPDPGKRATEAAAVSRPTSEVLRDLGIDKNIISRAEERDDVMIVFSQYITRSMIDTEYCSSIIYC